VPHYSWAHSWGGNKTKVYLNRQNPTFARLREGVPIPISDDNEISRCIELVDDLREHVMRPQYVVFQEFFLNYKKHYSKAC